MNIRSFGWIQNPSDFCKLKRVVEILDSSSEQYKLLKENLVEEHLYHFKDIQKNLQEKLNNNREEFTYTELVGRNLDVNGKTPKSRKYSVPNALIQISLDSQSSNTRGKKFTDEWSSDGFLRWAVTLNFVKYNRLKDTFKITEEGKNFIKAKNNEEINNTMKDALLKYPPATRILDILDNNPNVTKFFIGNRLGFKDEPGFTSYPEELMVEWIKESVNDKEDLKIRNNVEGTADKYARMICGWLIKVGLVNKKSTKYKSSVDNKKITGFVNYSLSGKGKYTLRQIKGNSSNSINKKFLLWEFLAVKGGSKNYIRTRRAYILKFLEKTNSFKNLMNHLRNRGFEESIDVIKNDIQGLINIGIRIKIDETSVKLLDKLNDFDIPEVEESLTNHEKDNLELKEYFISKTTIPNKFITLLDLAFDGNSNLDFEIITSELFREVYKLNTKHLGGTRKPDILIWNKEFGIIADTKAYSKGYKKNISEEDKMVRYIDENTKRNEENNQNKWWEIFDKSIEVNNYFYLWISSKFIGKFEDQLKETASRTKINGAALNVYQLLMGGHLIQNNELSIKEIPQYMSNAEIKFV